MKIVACMHIMSKDQETLHEPVIAANLFGCEIRYPQNLSHVEAV